MNRRKFCLSAAASMALLALPVKAQQALTGIPGVSYGEDGVTWPLQYADIEIIPVLPQPEDFHVYILNENEDILFETHNLLTRAIYRHAIVADEMLTLQYFGGGFLGNRWRANRTYWDFPMHVGPGRLKSFGIHLPVGTPDAGY